MSRGDLFVLSWESCRLVCLFNVSSVLFIFGGWTFRSLFLGRFARYVWVIWEWIWFILLRMVGMSIVLGSVGIVIVKSGLSFRAVGFIVRGKLG